MYTPENISFLKESEVFVFGSNLKGQHGGGAAKLARKWGAKYPDLIFLVTKIGCGLAGHSPESIAPLFKTSQSIPNIILPVEFSKILQNDN